jgi:hypothetical protein
MLAPLTGLVSPLVKYKWGEEQQKAFEEIKQKLSQETLLAFPEFEKEFHVCTDESNNNWEHSLYRKENLWLSIAEN